MRSRWALPLLSLALCGLLTCPAGALEYAISAPAQSAAQVTVTRSGDSFTEVTEELFCADGSLGTLEIPAIGLGLV